MTIRHLEELKLTEKKRKAVYNKDADAKWIENNKERKNYLTRRSNTRGFIRNLATADDLMELQSMIVERLKSQDALRGFKSMLDEYGAKDSLRETKLKLVISELDNNGVKVNQFTFERFKQENHDDVKSDLIETLDNTIEDLEKALENVKMGKAPSIQLKGHNKGH